MPSLSGDERIQRDSDAKDGNGWGQPAQTSGQGVSIEQTGSAQAGMGYGEGCGPHWVGQKAVKVRYADTDKDGGSNQGRGTGTADWHTVNSRLRDSASAASAVFLFRVSSSCARIQTASAGAGGPCAVGALW